jgi:Domain of unknown function (DUF4132)
MWKRLRERLRSGQPRGVEGSEGGEVAGAPPDEAAWAPLLRELVRQVRQARRPGDRSQPSIPAHTAGQALLDLDPAVRTGLAVELLHLLGDGEALRRLFRTDGHGLHERQVIKALFGRLIRQRLPWSDGELAALVDAAATLHRRPWHVSEAGMLAAIKLHVEQHGLATVLDQALGRFLESLPAEEPSTGEERAIRDQVAALRAATGPASEGDPLPRLLRGGDAWSGVLREALAAMGDSARGAWLPLLEHCATARSARPTDAWLDRARELLAPVGAEAFAEVSARGLAAVGAEGEAPLRSPGGIRDATLIDDRDSDLLRGLIWTASLVPQPELIAALGRAARAAFHKIPGHGPRSVKVGNACLQALGRMEALAAAAELSHLRSRVRHPSTRKKVDQALEAAGERLGMDAADLEELATPTLGFQEAGIRRQEVGGFQAEVRTDGTRVELRFRTPAGKVQGSVPAALKEAFPQEASALRKTVAEVRRLLPGLRARLERLNLAPRDWDEPTWRARYADHPLMGTLARRLIWSAAAPGAEQARLVSWHRGAWVDAGGDPVVLSPADRLHLWHPIESPAATVQA